MRLLRVKDVVDGVVVAGLVEFYVGFPAQAALRVRDRRPVHVIRILFSGIRMVVIPHREMRRTQILHNLCNVKSNIFRAECFIGTRSDSFGL